MKHTLNRLNALLLAPLAALHAAEPPRKINDVYAPVWGGRPPSDAVSGLVRLENGELRHYDYGIEPTPSIYQHADFLPTSYVFSRDQGLTWETEKVPKGHLGADAERRLTITPQDGDWSMERHPLTVTVHGGPGCTLPHTVVVTEPVRNKNQGPTTDQRKTP